MGNLSADNIFEKIFFFGQFLRDPANIGSVCPSSRYLARSLAGFALSGTASQGLLIDLGAGSGAISRELLNLGVAPKRIYALDISERFSKLFRRQCPGIELHIDDARNLCRSLDSLYPKHPVTAVISSLPLRSMPLWLIREIMAEIRTILRKHNGALVQYTYAICSHSYLESFGFIKEDERRVMLNLPPALVEKYHAAA